MIKQHCIGSGRDCDRSTINLLWLIQILDGGRKEGFKDWLGFYCWHSLQREESRNPYKKDPMVYH